MNKYFVLLYRDLFYLGSMNGDDNHYSAFDNLKDAAQDAIDKVSADKILHRWWKYNTKSIQIDYQYNR